MQNSQLVNKFNNLCKHIQSYDNALIAFSGGTDSSLVAFLTNKLTDKSLCIIGDSKTVAIGEIEYAVNFCYKHQIKYRIVPHDVLNNEEFCNNFKNRCYHCKNDLYKTINKIRKKEDWQVIFDGSNYDDIDDFRPGSIAVKENGIITPLLDVKLNKMEIRKLSKMLQLETWDKPQLACLSSRFPYKTKINIDRLEKVDKAEKILKDHGYRNVRVRYHGKVARIEIGKDERTNLKKLKKIVKDIKKLGFKYVTLDLEGFRSGSLNE